MTNINKLVGGRIRYLRSQKSLSQEAFADKAGLHRSHVGQIERGECNVSLHTLALISGCLKIPPGRLFKGIGVPKLKAKR